MKNKFLSLIALLMCTTTYAQWPVSSGSQGTVTGTIGEVRNTNGRIHNGTDMTGSSTTVYAIQGSSIQRINNASSLGANKHVIMNTGDTYFHVEVLSWVAANSLQAQQINNGTTLVLLDQGDDFAEMVNQAQIHVHLVNGNVNFLNDGFGVTGFTFVDNVVPQYGDVANDPRAVEFFKDLAGTAWQAAQKFDAKVIDEGLAVADQPVILYGNVDVVANVFQQRITPTGGLGGGHLAPKFLGYSLTNSQTSAVEEDKLDNVQFNSGFGAGSVTTESAEVYRRIHSKDSRITNPYFIVTNPFSNAVSTEGKIPTDQFRDGDYVVKVRAKGAKGTAAGSPDLIADKDIKVRFDNFKTYVKRVQVSDENSLVKYLAEWSDVGSGPGAGGIDLDQRNNEPFKSGSQATINVTTSEKVPSLTLQLPSGGPINLDPMGTDGKEWTGTFTMPSSATKKVPLTFTSGRKLFGLQLNEVIANVKRDLATGNFQTTSFMDQNHELRVCPSEYPLTLDVSVVDGQEVTLTAAGGTTPYNYSMDQMPIPPNYQSTFGSTNTFTIEFDQNYVFKVQDNERCQAEKYYTLPRVPCDALVNAGGQGTDIKQVNLGNAAGTVSVNYEMFSVPDQITLTYRGTSQTTGIVSGSGVLSFQHTPQTGLSNTLVITMYAPTSGTAWNYQVTCPTSARLGWPSNAETSIASVSYLGDKIAILPLKGGENDAYELRYRILGENAWTIEYAVNLPYYLENNGKEYEVKVSKATSIIANGKLSIVPNPAHGKVHVQYVSETDGVIDLALYNSHGEQLMKENNIEVQKGTNSIAWDLNKIATGLVYVQVKQNGIYTLTKLVLEN